MNKSRKLAALFTGTLVVSMFTASSAFAESRHRDETRNDEWRRNHGDRQQSQTQRDSRQWRTESQNRHDSRLGNDAYHGSERNRGNDSYRGGSYNRAPVRNESRYYSGRVSRVEHWNNGFRVWVGGAPYPFFIGAERWRRFPIRVGIDLRLGGYWNPAGYYDAYDVGPYATAGNLHGLVENVDYRRGTMVLRDDVSGSFVTVTLRGNDPRLGELRTGDFVELTGAWNRAGVFDAYNVADIRGGYGRDDRRYDDRY